jgi:NADH-quinone oxidoreductase subunit G
MQEIAEDDVLGFLNRGSQTTLSVYPGKRLDDNYSLNTVDICPVGALTSKDFRFQMRVWFLKETKTIDVNCGQGTNILVGSRENVIYRITPRENDAVNSCWMPDTHRLNFHYLNDDARLKEPVVRGGEAPTKWSEAIRVAGDQLKSFQPSEIAIIASARMTNEELYLTKRLADSLGTKQIDVVARKQEGDGFLISEDGNPNTTGAKLLGVATGKLTDIAYGISSGTVKALICLGEDVTECGIDAETLEQLDCVIATAILPSATTRVASVLLPSAGFSEKRGSMINLGGRIQRLNRAVSSPGQARDDWEILRDLIQAVGGSNGIYAIEEVFKAMAADTPELAGLSLIKLGDLGVELRLAESARRV